MFDLFTSIVDKLAHIALSVAMGAASLFGFSADMSSFSSSLLLPQPLVEITKYEEKKQDRAKEGDTENSSATTTAKTPDEPPPPTQQTEKTDPLTNTTEHISRTVQEFMDGNKNTLSTEELNDRARAALVNIFCTSTNGSGLSATGSGVLIDKRGIILTNAHIGQYFLLEEGAGLVNCTIRSGAPAEPSYDADLLYLSPAWMDENASAITEREPLGTGENDFALLRITNSIRGAVLPEAFAFVEPDPKERTVRPDADVFVAGYPAGFLGGQTITRDLYPSSTRTNIERVFTFNQYTIDVFSLAGNILAQRGSSGAGVLHAQTGKLIGIIATSSIGGSTDDRTLQAISVAHMNRSLNADLGVSLSGYLNTDVAERADTFQSVVAPALRELLLQEIEK